MNRIKFTALNGNVQVAETNWEPEQTKDCALRLLTTFRTEHPNLAYRIERTGDSKQPNLRKLTRFQITLGDEIRYSREFEADEVDEQLAQIRERWSNAEIVAGVRYG